MKFLIPILLLLLYFPALAQDHSDFVSGPFETVQQVTEECLMCHDDSGEEVLKSNHWNWFTSNLPTLVEPHLVNGKHIPINNFCFTVDAAFNQCTNCHLPLNGKDASFEFNFAENIDCLICHDQTGTYKRSPFGTGLPDAEMDLLAIAQSVGKRADKNCGSCHFGGSGGALMRSVAMDKSLNNPAEEIDFHIGSLGFGCGDCHSIKGHNIGGGSKASCENCHDTEPHEKELLNQHSSAVSCQTCHIPTYARTEPAITFWDWSKAGEDRESVKNEFGEENYFKSKGELVWAKNIRPEYYWNNGNDDYYELGEKNEKAKSIDLNKPAGKISDPNSKISPYKVVRVKQPFDSANKHLIIPLISGDDGYSTTSNWVSASETGMQKINLEFSGTIDFIETKMYWPINHMVMSSDNALKCTSCHGKGGEGILNWKELGYPDDPLKKGGRVKNKLVKE
jgi:octaheme c-type cytochrome (tetrathionate reductase family)